MIIIKNIKRFDLNKKSKIGSVKKTDEGYIQGIVPVAKIGIMSYKLNDGTIRKELVNSETLFNKKSMDSLKLKPITNQHPPEKMLDKNTVKKRKIGMTGETIQKEDDILTTSIIITDSDAIESIKNGTNELSPGYTTDVLLESGEFNGEKYDGIQLNRKYNHFAICDFARGGHDIKINTEHIDGYEYNYEENKNKNSQKEKKEMPKITINKINYESPQEVINHVDSLTNEIKILVAKNDSLISEKTKLTAEKDTLKEDHEKLNESIPAIVQTQVETKLKIDSICKIVFNEDELKKLKELNIDEKKKAVILKKYPKADFTGKDEVYINARFDACIENLQEENKNDAINNQRKTAKSFMFSTNFDESDGDSAYNEMVKRNQNAWKNK